MQERHVLVPTDDGLMNTFIARPDGEGPFPAVVVYHNVRGLEDGVRSCARRLAEHGYYAVAPDLYYRFGQVVFDAEPPNDEETAKVRRIVLDSVYRPYQVTADTASLFDFIDADPVVGYGPKGTIGFCLGGYFSVLVAGMFPDVVRAASSIHPFRILLDSPERPELVLDKIGGELYFGIAELDKGTPPEFVTRWGALLEEKCTATWQIEVHEGAEHGFAVPGRRIYLKPAADLIWQRSLAMFARQLR